MPWFRHDILFTLELIVVLLLTRFIVVLLLANNRKHVSNVQLNTSPPGKTANLALRRQFGCYAAVRAAAPHTARCALVLHAFAALSEGISVEVSLYVWIHCCDLEYALRKFQGSCYPFAMCDACVSSLADVDLTSVAQALLSSQPSHARMPSSSTSRVPSLSHGALLN